ncbi:MAG: formyltetrahydrofolate deformylase, partial [Pseudonocardiales bacterium]|nr:formyltetrahydrofolate deformylase [Pseudonocardiales bacterium]
MTEPATRYPEYVLTIVCPDRPGIVFAVASFLVHSSGNILESQQYDDRLEQRFFMRVQFEVYDAAMTLERLRAGFEKVALASDMTWQMWDAEAKYQTLVMVSKDGHCLNDLLYRQSTGALPIEIPAIVSNHPDLERLAKS